MVIIRHLWENKNVFRCVPELQILHHKDAYSDIVKDSKYADNKELLIIPDVVHTDLYDGGDKDYIPFDKLQSFYEQYLQ